MIKHPPKASSKKRRVSEDSLVFLGGSVPVLGYAKYQDHRLNKLYPKEILTTNIRRPPELEKALGKPGATPLKYGKPIKIRGLSVMRNMVKAHQKAINANMLAEFERQQVGSPILARQVLGANIDTPMRIYEDKVHPKIKGEILSAVTKIKKGDAALPIDLKNTFNSIIKTDTNIEDLTKAGGDMRTANRLGFMRNARDTLRTMRETIYNPQTGYRALVAKGGVLALGDQSAEKARIMDAWLTARRSQNYLLRKDVEFALKDMGAIKMKRAALGVAGVGLLAAGAASLYNDYKKK